MRFRDPITLGPPPVLLLGVAEHGVALRGRHQPPQHPFPCPGRFTPVSVRVGHD